MNQNLHDLLLDEYRNRNRKSEFIPGLSHVPVSGKTVYPEDILNVVESVLEGWFTSGRHTSNFEKLLANYIGVRSAKFVNSGSSANLVALSSLTSAKLGSRALKAGDEVITASVGFPTTVNPIIQNGLVPVFVDIDLNTLEANVGLIEEAITNKTKAIMMAHTLGNPFDIDAVTALCEKYGLFLIEDNCDALGSTYKGKKTGSFGDVSTLSFYPAHHITTGEGGAVLANNPLILRQIESFRDWGRDCYCDTGIDDTCKKRFGWKLGDLPDGYDHKYIYSHVGYNLKATEMQAALGVSQFEHLPEFIEARRSNFTYLASEVSALDEIQIVEAQQHSNPSWFGFPIIIKEESELPRNHMIAELTKRNIGTRLIFGGNLVRQPAYQNAHFRQVGNMKNSNLVTENAFWIGLHPAITREMLDYQIASIKEIVSGK